eukprot:4649430-Pleurochrysis_carterae.AAC.1
MGIPQHDGHLPAAVVKANAIAANCALIAEAAFARGADFMIESPVARGAGSRFAIEGKNQHVDMFTHDAFVRLSQLP